MAYNHNNQLTHMLHDKWNRPICAVFGEIATELNGDVAGKDLYTWMNDAGDETTNCLLDGTPNRLGSYVVPLANPTPIIAAMRGAE